LKMRAKDVVKGWLRAAENEELPDREQRELLVEIIK